MTVDERTERALPDDQVTATFLHAILILMSTVLNVKSSAVAISGDEIQTTYRENI